MKEIYDKLYLQYFLSRDASSFCTNTHVDDYYNPAFHFCQPEGGPKRQSESLGSILFGDRIFNSPYDVRTFALPVLVALTISLNTLVSLPC